MAVNIGFLDRSRYFSIQVAPQLSSWGWALSADTNVSMYYEFGIPSTGTMYLNISNFLKTCLQIFSRNTQTTGQTDRQTNWQTWSSLYISFSCILLRTYFVVKLDRIVPTQHYKILDFKCCTILLITNSRKLVLYNNSRPLRISSWWMNIS
jgi:hypothetical protein